MPSRTGPRPLRARAVTGRPLVAAWGVALAATVVIGVAMDRVTRAVGT